MKTVEEFLESISKEESAKQETESLLPISTVVTVDDIEEDYVFSGPAAAGMSPPPAPDQGL